MRYLFVAEDGCLSQADEVPDDMFEAHDEGIFDIVDMESGTQYEGNGKWGSILPR